jgi:replicative DNA helicase
VRPRNDFIQILKNFTTWRRLIAGTENVQRRCFAQEPVPEILESLSSLISGDSMIADRIGPVFAKDAIDQIGIERLLSARKAHGIRLPWSKLDDVLAGLHAEEVTVIAAHTSGGKTSVALQIAAHAAAQRVGVLIVSLEMSKQALLRRMIRQRARVTDFEDLDSERRSQVREAANWIYQAPIAFDESAQTLPGIHASLRKLRTARIGLVIVDYLQLIRSVGRHENRVQEISANSRALKLAAKEFRIPFVVLSQFSRESAKEGRPPELYDLKGCGDIENDSDNVLFIHPTSRSEIELVPVDVIIAKQREGPRNLAVPMLFDTRYQRLELRDRDDEQK